MVFLAKKPAQGVKKLDKEHYLVLATGEVKEYQLSDKKQVESLRKTFAYLRRLINTNFSGRNNELFLTLTYAQNMQDAEKLYIDFKNFFKRLRYHDKREFAYIAIAEPQGRGAWHLHVLLKAMDGQYLYMDNRVMSDLWGHGWTETKRLEANNDNLGAYFVAYFTNTEEGHPGLIADTKKAKQYKKGGRLKYYPKDFKFFRTSRNIKRPVVEDVTYSEVIAEYGEAVFTQAFELVEDDEVKNLIVKQQFNKKRK